MSYADDSETESALKKAGAAGLDYEHLFEESGFSAKVDLSREIHRLTQLGIVYKRGNRYYHFEANASQETKVEEKPKETVSATPVVHTPPKQSEPSVAAEPAPVTPEVKAEPIVNKPSPKPSYNPFGTIRRTKQGVGSVALAFFRTRALPFLSRKDILYLSGLPSARFSTVINKLIEENYIISQDGGGGIVYRWSDQFRYPFSSPEKDDDDLLVEDYTEWLAVRTNSFAQGTPAVVPNTKKEVEMESPSLAMQTPEAQVTEELKKIAVRSNEHAMDFIDTHIAFLEHQLGVFNKLKSLLSVS